ncbi:protein FAM177A1 isoform X2 [Cryptotermes secundus]|uniref:protein FAM177A1 isoform X2 n=1 Tax=Cryptotermes secundus TaxID=105785 RepID=UPI000CD7B4C0|nr:protein FAM177A1 isoform X2 [Cryptotermes secundus]
MCAVRYSKIDCRMEKFVECASTELLPLKATNETEDKTCKITVRQEKVPRRILHFSDGTLEEYSSDEDEPDIPALVTAEVQPSMLPWGPWIWYHTVNVGRKSLQVCDYMGEHLASILGITTPKYQYEIDEYNSIMAEEEERQKKKELEMGGWTGTPAESEDPIQVPPAQENDTTHPTAQRDSNVDENRF